MPLAVFPKCFLNAMCVEKSMSVDQWIHLACTEIDIDGLEFYSEFLPLENTAELRRYKKVAGDHGKSIPMLCCSPDFTHPNENFRSAEIEKEKRCIIATAELGGRFCRVLSGQRRPDVSRADGVRYASSCINSLIPFAKQHDVVLILENHYKDSRWTQPEFAQKRDVFLELLAAIDQSPNFGVNYDPSNATIAGEDPIVMLDAVKNRVVSMHASDRYFEGGTFEDLKRLEVHPQTGYATILKHGVVGRGLNDFDAIFSRLKSVGFSGWISIEDGEDPKVGMDHLRESAIFLRKKMAQHGLK